MSRHGNARIVVTRKPQPKQGWKWLLAGILAIGLTAVVLLVLILSAESERRWKQWCTSVGGHVIEDREVKVKPTRVNGRSSTTTTLDVDFVCLDKNGRILGELG